LALFQKRKKPVVGTPKLQLGYLMKLTTKNLNIFMNLLSAQKIEKNAENRIGKIV
jgi:hypothetical protein